MPQPSALPRHALLLAAAALLGALLWAAAPAQAAKLPTISRVTPLKLEVGQELTITGRNFLRGRNRNIVVFKRDGKPAIFAKAQSATTTRISLKVPAKLMPFLAGSNGAQSIKRFRLRVLARKLGRAFTATKLSPQIGPPGSMGGNAAPANDCDNDKILNATDPDDDNDGLPDALEKTYKTSTCLLDTDSDGVGDGFEVESALDLNLRALPFPEKKPYPNALDGTDAAYDFDQDGLTLAEEYAIWLFTGGRFPLTYSDGDQDTTTDGADTVVAPGNRLDINADGILTDDEKDVDADGLSNWDETNGRMKASWWKAVFQSEKQYVGAAGASPLPETSVIDRDSDGDGLIDGQDDQDHDGWTNEDEIGRGRVFPDGKRYWVHPYNPCLPNYLSRVCSLHPPIQEPWAPFPLPSPLPPNPLELTATP